MFFLLAEFVFVSDCQETKRHSLIFTLGTLNQSRHQTEVCNKATKWKQNKEAVCGEWYGHEPLNCRGSLGNKGETL